MKNCTKTKKIIGLLVVPLFSYLHSERGLLRAQINETVNRPDGSVDLNKFQSD